MKQVLIDAVHYYNKSATDLGMIDSGMYGPKPSFRDMCKGVEKKLLSVDAFNQKYWEQINAAKNILVDVATHTVGLSDKLAICPLILVFAELLARSTKPKYKIFIDLYKCLYYSEYGIIDPLSIPFGLGLKDTYSDIMEM